MSKKLWFTRLLPVLLAAGCGTTAKLKVQSEPPEAEVYVSQQRSTEKKLIGKTPLEISYNELFEKAGSSVAPGEFLNIYVQAKNFETEKVLLPPNAFGNTSTMVQVKLQATNEVINAGQILQRLHNAQKFAQSAQFERAHIEVDHALEIDPKFIRALSLKASIYYLEKKYDDSVKWYEKALAIDSSFDEAVKMISRIKQETGRGSKQ